MCLAGAVIASWSLTQEMAGLSLFTVMTNILSLNSANWMKTFSENSIIVHCRFQFGQKMGIKCLESWFLQQKILTQTYLVIIMHIILGSWLIICCIVWLHFGRMCSNIDVKTSFLAERTTEINDKHSVNDTFGWSLYSALVAPMTDHGVIQHAMPVSY